MRILAWFFGLLAALVLVGLILAGVAVAMAYPQLPSLDNMADYRPKEPLKVFSRDGVLLGQYGEERRIFVPINEIPKVMQEAVLAIEDARFYEHGGVDFIGIARALADDLGQSSGQGASTITMQLARNFYLSTEKTYTRKLYEALLARKIEQRFSKQQILELYMNQIYLGQRAYGFGAAAEAYFGKPLQKITLAEAAMLAGLPKAPSAYNPIVNEKRALLRQRYILQRMAELGLISSTEREQALAQKLVYRQPVQTSTQSQYVAELARQLLYSQYGESAYERGLQVYLTVSIQSQDAAYRALRAGLRRLDAKRPYRGPEARLELPAKADELDDFVGDKLENFPAQGGLVAAVVTRAKPGSVTVMFQDGQSVNITGEGLRLAGPALMPGASAKTRITRGAIVRTAKVGESYTIVQTPEVEGALIAMNPNNGFVTAMAGGFDFYKNKFDHVTQAWRQPGSSFKPFIYSAGLEKGFMPGTWMNDAPLRFSARTTGGEVWNPKNYDGRFEGPMTLRRALAKSKNLVSIRLLREIGPEYGRDWATRFGFDPKRNPPYLTLALGSGTTTPMQMAAAYGVFANGGHLVQPVIIQKILNSRGEVLFEAPDTPPGEDRRVIPARNAFIMGTMLNEVARKGTAARAQKELGRPDIYGKTGTTNGSYDAWFAGFQPNEVAVVWVGYDTPRSLGARETGGGLALPIWIDFMKQALKDQPVVELKPPPGVVRSGGDWTYPEFVGRGPSRIYEDDAAPRPRPKPRVRRAAPSVDDSGEDDTPVPVDNSQERQSIIDMFSNGNGNGN
ncbi:penicillin-binding protein 1A [Amphibiibacter pelophylacis]|uniref:PBP1A family penicillin-binding protein n=1 Tax=Amphibiibacter pelophylacis TaxID=1799477 RepID=A0ACC6P491_9BURK